MASCNDDITELGPSPTGEPKLVPSAKPRATPNRVSVVVGHSASSLIFDGKTRVGINRRAILATYERRLSSRWTLQFAAGAIAMGTLTVRNDRYHFGPGFSAGISTSYRALDGRGSKPFVLFGGTLAIADAMTQAEKGVAPTIRYLAGDIRLNVVVGKTFFQALSPYAVARVFGGPISWKIAGKDAIGTDAYHYQIGAGMAVSMPFGLDAFFEAVPLGEKALSTGLGYSF